MKKRFISVIFAISMLVALVLPIMSIGDVGAKSGGVGVPPGKIEQLEPGWQRVSPNVKTHHIGTEVIHGKKHDKYETEISSLPVT